MGNASSGPHASLYQTGAKLQSSVSGLFDLYDGLKKDASQERVSIFIFDPSKVSAEANSIVSSAAEVR